MKIDTFGKSEAAHAVTAARDVMLRDFPFFGFLSLNLDVIEDASLDEHTMTSTDGELLRFNPAAVLDRHPDELVADIALAAASCHHGHPWRRGDRDPDIWDQAREYAISPYLRAAGMRLGANVKHDERFADMSAEQIHAVLAREQRQQQGQEGKPGGTGANAPGAGRASSRMTDGKRTEDDKKKTAGEPADGQTEWQIRGFQAEATANRIGNSPGLQQALIEPVRSPQPPWTDLLRRFFDSQAKTDSDWSRPNKRYLAAGLYLPTLRSRKMGEFCLFIDTSKSVWPVLDKFASAYNALMEDIRPEVTHLIYWDTQCQGYERYERDDGPVRLEPKGGGGTNFRECWTWLDEQGIEPAVTVFLTDLETHFPETEPSSPVLWAVVGQLRNAPFGEIVPIDEV